MTELRNALRRKLGPLPAWAWAGIAFLLLYYYRNRLSGSKTISTTNTPAGINTSPTLSPLDLAPGESVYDPNTGQLITTPTGEPPAGGLVPPGFNQPPVPDPAPGATPSPSAPNVPASKKRPRIGSAAGPHGAKVLAYGRNKPKAPRGTRVVGVGNGEWISIPLKAAKRVVKRKPQSTKATTKPPTHGQTRSRSSAAVRNPGGGRTAPHTKQTTPPKSISRTSPVKPTPVGGARQRPTAPVASHPVVKQRPVASNPPTKHVTHAGNPPRPSAPPPRKTRVPAKRHK